MWNPDVTVAAICEQDGRFLLVEEISKSSGKIVFNQPAGHLEDGETIEQAVVRETLEETCCHFTPKALIRNLFGVLDLFVYFVSCFLIQVYLSRALKEVVSF